MNTISNVVSIKFNHTVLPVQSKCRAIYPLNIKNKRVQKVTCKNYQEVIGLLLARKYSNKEQEVCVVVENCHENITKTVQGFFAPAKAYLKVYVEQKNKRSFVDLKKAFEEIIPAQQMEKVLQGIKHDLQQELQQLYGVTSYHIAGMHVPAVNKHADTLANHTLQEQYGALLVSHYMTKASNKVWGKAVEQYQFTGIMKNLMDKLELGSIFMKIIECEVDKQRQQYQRDVEKRLLGMIQNVEHRLLQELHQTTSIAFYELYDAYLARQVKQKIKQWETNKQYKFNRHKQAVISR